MAAANYPHPIEDYVLRSEGGYTDNPRDPGGPTNFGITIYDARLYWKKDATAADVRAMPLSVAQDIYRKRYWAPLTLDAVPGGLDYTLFDYGVNSGIARSGRVLRQALGLQVSGQQATDWHVTPDVLAAIARHDAAELVKAINTERLSFLRHLSTWDEFGKGWGARVASVEAISLHMAAAAAPAPALQILPRTATPDVPAAKAVADPHDLFAHLAAGAGWTELWGAVSNFVTH